MMKRLSLRGLRLSTAGTRDEEEKEEEEERTDHPQQPTHGPDGVSDTAAPGGVVSADSEPPTTPTKKREKKGFFKTLKRKLTGNFRGKRDSVSGVVVVEEDSSSEARDDSSLLQCGPLRRPPSSRGPPPAVPVNQPADPDVTLDKKKRHHGDGDQNQQGEKQQLSKDDVSRSEEAGSSTPTEEDKVQGVFLTDAEYGHASAPFPQTAAMDLENVPVVVCHPEPGNTGALDTGENMSTWPQTAAPPLPPPSPGVDSVVGAGAGSSDSETQGACAQRTAGRTYSNNNTSDVSDTDIDPPPLHAPPPPPSAPSPTMYNTPSENNFRGHLALVGGGCIGDPSKLLPVYDQLKEPPKSWSLTKELFKLSKFGWYWGPITRVEAEEKLTNQTDGAFLVRDSSDERYLLSLSFRSYGRTLHTRIEHCNGVFSFYAQPESEGYYSIVDLIEHSMNDSQTGVFCYSRARTPGSPSFPVRLTKPVSRFTQVRSLQYLCRFVIRQYTRFDHIQKLPLPPRIKGWLEENQY